jgi:kumamolisin
MLYAGAAAGVAAPGFNDITEGNNGAYKAGAGWDACTGLGSPNGGQLLTLLSGTTPSTGTASTGTASPAS